MLASCGFLEEEVRQFSIEEGVIVAESVKTLGVDLRTRVKKLRAKSKNARRKKCKVRLSLFTKNKAFQKNDMKVEVKKLLQAGLVPLRTCRVQKDEKRGGRWNQQRAKRARPLCLCSWKRFALRSGQNEHGQENGARNKKKHGKTRFLRFRCGVK